MSTDTPYTLHKRLAAITCRCLGHRGLRLVLAMVIWTLNVAHPFLHAFGLEGGSLDALLPALNAQAALLASDVR